MRAQLGALVLVLLAPNAIAYSADFQPTSTVPDQQALDMPIVAFTTLTMAESTTQPESYNANSGSTVPGEQIDSENAQPPSLPLNLVNEHVRKKMDQDLYKFKSIILRLTDSPDIQSESVDSDSSLVPGEQLFGTPTSSAPRVISINVVMPTFAIKITEDAGASDVETVLTIASFINNVEETTRASPIFGAAEVTPEPQRAPSTVARFTKASITSTRIPDRYPTASAVQRHEITLDEMELLSILHLQSVAPTEASAAPHAGFYGIPMHAPSVAQGISSPPVFTMASPYPYPPMPQPVSSAVEPSRSWPTPRHTPNNSQRLKSKTSGKPHRSAFIGMSPDAVASGSIDGSADSPAGYAPPAPYPRVTVTQSIYASSAPSPSVLRLPPLPPLPASSPPARSYYLSSHLNQPEVTPAAIHDTQAPGITVLLRPTRLAPLELESQDSPLGEPVVVLPPPPEATANPPPTMFVDSPPQQNTPIIPFISNGSRLPIPTPQDPKAQEAKGDMSPNGLASLLENVLHIPANAITINGKPISENSNIIAGKKGQGNIVIVGAKGAGGFANRDGDDDDEDDDDMDSDWDNESTTTHMLDVDRARNHRRVGSKTLDLDESSEIRSSKASEDSSDDEDNDDDDDSASGSDDDSDSDNDDTVESPSSTSSTPSFSSSSTVTSSIATNAESTTPLPTESESSTFQSTESITSSSSSSLTSSSLESLSSIPSSSTVPSEAQTTSSLISSSSSFGSSQPSTSTSTEVVESARGLLSLARLLST